MECITRSESGGIVERAEESRDPQLTTRNFPHLNMAAKRLFFLFIY